MPLLLHPEPPLDGEPIPIDASPFWIGSGLGAHCVVPHPGIADRHVALVEREDGIWMSAAAPTRIGGLPADAPRLLRHGDVLTLTSGVAFTFRDGTPQPTEPSGRSAVLPPASPRRLKQRVRLPALDAVSISLAVAVGLMVVLLVAAGLYTYRVIRAPEPQVLSEPEASAFDSLLSVAYEHVERGTALLEAGANDVALDEFVQGVNTLATSSLRAHPYVQPRIEALQASVAAIYRERRLSVPVAYRHARAGTTTPSASLAATLTADDFLAAFESVQQAFLARFNRRVEITGSDHAEHMSLYGRAGALDLRTRDLTEEQLRFLVAQCLSRGIRVKDFSKDAVLQRQIAAARRAGHDDRAGTGLHLHIDRFGGRRDRWTVRAN